MLFLVLTLIAASVCLSVLAVGELLPDQPRALTQRLAELESRRMGEVPRPSAQRRELTRQRVMRFLTRLGTALLHRGGDSVPVRQVLIRAGYRHPDAVRLFWGARLALMAGLGLLGLFGGTLVGIRPAFAVVAACWFAVIGWLMPMLVVRAKQRRRQRVILRALPDALDLLVVCVEAGLGLNQAMMRTAEEIRHFSPVAGEEFGLVNLEIRAGSPRDEALRNLGERTDLAELRSLAAMLVQTDRFGTSIGQALRVHAESLRSQRRQRTEELAAKTSVKLIFPLVLCIFPAIFVVVLGPALIQMYRTFAAQ